jgi:hypothetical protein
LISFRGPFTRIQSSDGIRNTIRFEFDRLSLFGLFNFNFKKLKQKLLERKQRLAVVDTSERLVEPVVSPGLRFIFVDKDRFVCYFFFFKLGHILLSLLNERVMMLSGPSWHGRE